MSLTVNQAQINSAAKGNSGDLRESLTGLWNEVQKHAALLGTGAITKVDSKTVATAAAPPAASFTVTGSNGTFTAQITNPQSTSKSLTPANSLQTTIYHELSSATDANFSSDVTVYPLTSSLTFSTSNPGASLYWRLRSSYDRTTFNTYRAQSGAVAAGLVTSAASNPNLSLNQTNFATVDSVPNGTTATIRVYGKGGVGTSWSRAVGTDSPVIPGGAIANIAYGYNGFVAYDGTNYRISNQLAKTFPDSWIPVGAVSVVANASGLVVPTVLPVIVSGSVVAYQITNAGNDLGSVTLTVVGTGTGAKPVGTIKNGQLVDVSGPAGSGYGSSGTTVTVSATANPGTPGGGGNAGGNGGRLYTVNS